MATEHGAGGLFRVQGIRLALGSALLSVGADDLQDTKAGSVEDPGDSGTVGAGSLNTHCVDVAMSVQELHDLAIPLDSGVELVIGY